MVLLMSDALLILGRPLESDIEGRKGGGGRVRVPKGASVLKSLYGGSGLDGDGGEDSGLDMLKEQNPILIYGTGRSPVG